MNFVEKTTFNAIFQVNWNKYKKLCQKNGIKPNIEMKEKIKNEAIKNYEALKKTRKERKKGDKISV